MKRKTIIFSAAVFILSALYSCGDCFKGGWSYPMTMRNFSEVRITPCPACDDKGGVYPDTILSFGENAWLGYIEPNRSYTWYFTLPLDELIASLPKDTLSIYVFSRDTLDKYSWEEIKNSYNVLVRYDLSLEDLILLHGQYNTPHIPYPPSEVMKDMKMYPPYGSK